MMRAIDTYHLSKNVHDNRISGSLAGLGFVHLVPLVHLYLSQIKIKWYSPNKHVCPCDSYRIYEKTWTSGTSCTKPYWWRVSAVPLSGRFLDKPGLNHFTQRYI